MNIIYMLEKMRVTHAPRCSWDDDQHIEKAEWKDTDEDKLIKIAEAEQKLRHGITFYEFLRLAKGEDMGDDVDVHEWTYTWYPLGKPKYKEA